MKSLLAFSSLFLFFHTSIAQPGYIDSLKSALSETALDTNRVNTLNHLSVASRDLKVEESIRYAEEAVKEAQHLRFARGEVLAWRNLGIAQGTNNDYTAIESLKKSSALAEKIGDLKSAARNSSLIAGAYLNRADLAQAMKYYLRCFNISESIEYTRGIAIGLAGIGNVYSREKNYEKALEHLVKSYVYFKDLNDPREMARTHLNIGSIYRETNRWNESIDHYKKALAIYDSTNNQRGAAYVLSDIGDLYFRSKKYDLSLQYLNRALTMHQQNDWPIELATDYLRFGKVYEAIDQPDLAITNFKLALTFAERMNLLDLLSELNHELAHVYKSKNDYRNALMHHEMHVAYFDSVFNNQKRQEMAELQTRFETEAREREIQILRKDKQIERIYLITIGGALLLGAIIFGLIVNRKRLQVEKDHEISKRELQIAEEQRALTESELLRQRLQADQLESELEFKNKELTTFALHLIQKNELLDELKSKISEIRTSVDESAKAGINRLLSSVNFSSHLDKDWETFKLHFEQVHKGFFEQLIKEFPDLSAHDLKICALLKLNLGTKEMATILDISPDSVKAARYRIRKKVGARSQQNLHSFFAMLEEK